MTAAIASRTACVRADIRPQGRGLRIVPILGPSADQPSYQLLTPDTLPRVRIGEISKGGSVPELVVENDLDQCVFLMDGQELVGAKQNRILNTDVLVAAHSTIVIPVSCVERRRWNYVSPTFAAGKSASHRTRSSKQSRVHNSLKRRGKHDADQLAVWAEVQESLACAGAASPSEALSAAYDQRKTELDNFKRGLEIPSEAVGVAVFHGRRFQGLDLFDRHGTLERFWDTLVDSYAIDWLGEPLDPQESASSDPSPEAQTVREMLNLAAAGEWESFRSPGLGKDYRLSDARLVGSALVYEDRSVIHLQLFPTGAGK